jgi:hypothetical protein
VMSLVRRDLIGPDRSLLVGEDAFRFRHLLIRDAAYEAAPKAIRAGLHERYAAWIVDVAGDRVEEQEEIVAYHLERAYRLHEELGPLSDAAREVGLRAATHYAACGRRASERGDESAAATLFRHAADLLPQGHTYRPSALYEVARAYGNTFEPRLAFAAADEAMEAAATAGQSSIGWLARLERSFAQQLMDPHGKPTQEIRDELALAIAALDEAGDEAGLAIAWRRLAEIEWMPCRFDIAGEAADRAVEHARRAGKRSLLVHAMGIRAAAELFGTMRPDEMLASLEAAASEIGEEGLFGHLMLVQRSACAAMVGDLETARRLSDDAIALAERIGVAFFVAVSCEFRGGLELQAGDAVAAEQAYRKQYEALDRLGDEGHKSTAAAELANALCRLDRLDEAETFARMALDIAAEDDLVSQASGRCARALVRSAWGEHDDAIRSAREAVEIFADAESPVFQGNTWMTLAEVLRAAGQQGEAADAARSALALFERKGNKLAVASSQAFLGALDA